MSTPPLPADAGWHPDPSGRFEVRYFDGTAWTDHVSTAGTQSRDPFDGRAAAVPPPPGVASAAPLPSKPRRRGRKLIGGAVVIAIIAAAASGSSDSSKDGGSGSGDSGGSATTAASTGAADTGVAKSDGGGGSGCGTKATDDCTPHVPSGGSVRVDALIWRVRSVRTAKTLGDQTYGLGAKAQGRFVVVKLRVHSDKNESATLSDDTVKLVIGGNTYDADNDGTVAAMGSGEQPFFLDTVGPDADRDGTVVFDLPTSVLHKKIEVRFNELGFGSTHGYVALPRQ